MMEYAVVKMLDNYLRDVRTSNVGNGWRLEPIPKAVHKAIEALGLTPPRLTPRRSAYGLAPGSSD